MPELPKIPNIPEISKDPLLEIIYQDSELVVVNKPSGLLSVPGRGEDKIDSVTHRVQQLFPDCIATPAVHRLDMDTSGLMVVALTAHAQRNLSIQFQDRRTKKYYEALLEGRLDENTDEKSGRIELPFRLDVDNRPIQIYDEEYGKMGITNWCQLGIEGEYTRISFEPVTGRTHQLRLHAYHEKGLGIPIVDDPFYGNGTRAGAMKLHACELSFYHPQTEEWLTFSAAPKF